MDLLVWHDFALGHSCQGIKFCFWGPHHFTPEFDVCADRNCCCVNDSTTTSSKDEKDNRETITTTRCDTTARNGKDLEPLPLSTALVAMLRKEQSIVAVSQKSLLITLLLVSTRITTDGGDCGPNFLSPLIQALTLGFFDVQWLMRYDGSIDKNLEWRKIKNKVCNMKTGARKLNPFEFQIIIPQTLNNKIPPQSWIWTVETNEPRTD